jgi:hypothetical protein
VQARFDNDMAYDGPELRAIISVGGQGSLMNAVFLSGQPAEGKVSFQL